MHNIEIIYHQQNPRQEIPLTITLFDTLDECLAVIGKAACLTFINEAIIKKAKLDWNNRYCKELRDDKR